MADVTIPADVAKRIAKDLRVAADDTTVRATWTERDTYREWADLLDPKPPTVRDLCLAQIPPLFDEESAVDAVLEVVRQRIESLRRPAALTTLDGAIDCILTDLAGGTA